MASNCTKGNFSSIFQFDYSARYLVFERFAEFDTRFMLSPEVASRELKLVLKLKHFSNRSIA